MGIYWVPIQRAPTVGVRAVFPPFVFCETTFDRNVWSKKDRGRWLQWWIHKKPNSFWFFPGFWWVLKGRGAAPPPVLGGGEFELCFYVHPENWGNDLKIWLAHIFFWNGWGNNRQLVLCWAQPMVWGLVGRMVGDPRMKGVARPNPFWAPHRFWGSWENHRLKQSPRKGRGCGFVPRRVVMGTKKMATTKTAWKFGWFYLPPGRSAGWSCYVLWRLGKTSRRERDICHLNLIKLDWMN